MEIVTAIFSFFKELLSFRRWSTDRKDITKEKQFQVDAVKEYEKNQKAINEFRNSK